MKRYIRSTTVPDDVMQILRQLYRNGFSIGGRHHSAVMIALIGHLIFLDTATILTSFSLITGYLLN